MLLQKKDPKTSASLFFEMHQIFFVYYAVEVFCGVVDGILEICIPTVKWCCLYYCKCKYGNICLDVNCTFSKTFPLALDT